MSFNGISLHKVRVFKSNVFVNKDKKRHTHTIKFALNTPFNLKQTLSNSSKKMENQQKETKCNKAEGLINLLDVKENLLNFLY